ncbi:MAG: MotA/TolQ/ExbB proton channel family protein [Bdellovibrionales bacterium]|nr:MotA/TolQ/ExbB proton channel family protein [Bdellovibrionales bacterium]
MFTHQFFIVSQIGHEATLWVLFILSVLSIAVLLERFFLLRQWKKSSSSACKDIRQAIENGKPEWIKNVHLAFENIDQNAGTQFLNLYFEKKPHMIPQVFRSFISSQKAQLEAHLNILATIGSNAPFIGLLGTIFGVIEAFNALGTSAGSATPIVMLGIAKALLATAVGLLVAIPAIVAYNYLRKQVRTILQNLENIEGGYQLYLQSLKHETKGSPEENQKPAGHFVS